MRQMQTYGIEICNIDIWDTTVFEYVLHKFESLFLLQVTCSPEHKLKFMEQSPSWEANNHSDG
jgi:hypothetical protein